MSALGMDKQTRLLLTGLLEIQRQDLKDLHEMYVGASAVISSVSGLLDQYNIPRFRTIPHRHSNQEHREDLTLTERLVLLAQSQTEDSK